MTIGGSLDEQLSSTQSALEAAISNDYPRYTLLLESFLCGRMTKEELEGGLRTVLRDSLPNYDLHNKYVGLVLEKLAAAEAEALTACRTCEVHVESATLPLTALAVTGNDHAFFRTALSRPVPSIPLASMEEEMVARFQAELMSAEKLAGRPLLSQIAEALPNSGTIKALLECWLRAYELDVASIEEEHLSLVMQGLEDYLKSSLMMARDRTLPKPDGLVVISGDSFAATTTIDHFPLIISNLIHVNTE